VIPETKTRGGGGGGGGGKKRKEKEEKMEDVQVRRIKLSEESHSSWHGSREMAV